MAGPVCPENGHALSFRLRGPPKLDKLQLSAPPPARPRRFHSAELCPCFWVMYSSYSTTSPALLIYLRRQLYHRYSTTPLYLSGRVSYTGNQATANTLNGQETDRTRVFCAICQKPGPAISRQNRGSIDTHYFTPSKPLETVIEFSFARNSCNLHGAKEGRIFSLLSNACVVHTPCSRSRCHIY